MTGHPGYTALQAAYDLRKLRGKNLVVKPGSTRRYHVPPHALRTITALTTLRDQVLAPLLGAVRATRTPTKRSTWTDVERDYDTLASTWKPSSTISGSPLPRNLSTTISR